MHKILRNIKNVLVTGGAGFMGSSFIRLVLNKKEFNGSIVNLDKLTYAGNLKNLSSIENYKNYFFYNGDILDTQLVEKICKDYNIDTIVNFAAETHVDRSIDGPKAFLYTNILGTHSLLDAVRNNKHIHFHHISTDEVYGELKDNGYFTEDSLYLPNSPYAASKASSDHIVRSYAKTYDLSTTLSHSTNNYGPYQNPEKLIPLMILNCLGGKNLPVYGDGKNVRDWVYVDDHAEAVWKIINYGKKSEVYNISAECEKTNFQIVNSIIDIISKKTKKDKHAYLSLIKYVKDRPGHDFRYAISAKKITGELNWKPSKTFIEALDETINWYMNNIDYCKNEDSFVPSFI